MKRAADSDELENFKKDYNNCYLKNSNYNEQSSCDIREFENELNQFKMKSSYSQDLEDFTSEEPTISRSFNQ
jgi:hypothetical protein